MKIAVVLIGLMAGCAVAGIGGCSAGVGTHGAHFRLGELVIPSAYADRDDYWRWHHHHRHCWTECNYYRTRCWQECD